MCLSVASNVYIKCPITLGFYKWVTTVGVKNSSLGFSMPLVAGERRAALRADGGFFRLSDARHALRAAIQ